MGRHTRGRFRPNNMTQGNKYVAEVGRISMHRDLGWGLFVASFLLYSLTSSPAISWLDSPEFIAQATTLGVAHSPGHPLPALLGRLLGLLPIGDLVWRVNLASVLCASGAVTILFACLRLIIAKAAPLVGTRSNTLIALALALTAGASWALWSNAVRAEVYALQALLMVAALYALLRYDSEERTQWLLAAAFLLALGLANHHLLALTVLLPALLFVLIRRSRPSPITYARAAGVGILGLCALLYLPIRSLTHPEVNFGAPHTLERFFWTLRGAAFSKSANLEHVSSPVVDTFQVLLALGEALTVPLLFFALYGAWVGVRSQSTRRITGFFLGIVLLCCGARVLLGFDPETPDHHAYLLPAILSLYLLAALGIAHLTSLALQAKRPLPKAPALVAVALLLLPPIQLASNWKSSDQSDAWASDDMAHWELESLPPRSLLLLAYFQSSFRVWAMHSVEGLRPDVAVLDRSFLTYPGMREEALLRHPDLAPLIESPLQAGVPSPITLLEALATERPLRIQLHPNIDEGLARELRPAGPWASFEGNPSEDARLREELAASVQRAAPAERSAAQGALLWHDATRLDQLCIIGERDWARSVLSDALRLAPNDVMLGDMAKRCGL